MENQNTLSIFPIGFSSNFIHLLWAVFGGFMMYVHYLTQKQNKSYFFCSHILLCNLLTTILKPNFEEPLDTAKQLVEQNITIFSAPHNNLLKQFLLQSPIVEYNILGENNYIIPDDHLHHDNMFVYDVIGAGKYMGSYSQFTKKFTFCLCQVIKDC